MNEDDRVTLRDFILVQLHSVEIRFAQFVEHYEKRHEELRRRVEGLENMRSNLEGRVLATGAIVSLLLIAVQIMLHLWK